MKSRIVVLVIAMLLLTLSIASCGGGSSSLVSGGPNTGDSFVGVKQGAFSVVRYNDAGYRDGALNPTIELNTETNGNTTTVKVFVDDSKPMYGVALDLLYDTDKYSPQSVEFNGLIETPVELAFTGTAGIVNAGQVDVNGTSVRSGEFATIVFANSPNRSTSQVSAHTGPINVDYDPTHAGYTTGNGAKGFELLENNATSTTDATYRIRSVFATGDGSCDGGTTIGDLTPLISNGYWGPDFAISDSSYGTAQTDYSIDGETNISDLTPMANVLNKTTSQIDILLGDSATLSDADVLTTIAWGDGTAPSIPPAAGTTDWGQIFTTWEGAITQAQAQNADTNEDLTVYISARPSRPDTGGQTAFPGIALTYTQPFTPDVEVQAITIEVNGTEVADQDVIQLVANSTDVPLEITEISGMYGPEGSKEAFAPGTLPGTMTQAIYDAALADIQGLTSWTTTENPAADANFRRTVPIITITQGENDTATIGPDDDPDSTNANGEGLLTAVVPVSGDLVPTQIRVEVIVDVTADPVVPVINSIQTNPDDGSGNPIMSATTDSELEAYFDWGTTDPRPDIDEVGVQIYDFADPDAYIDLEFSSTRPPGIGQFYMEDNATEPGLGDMLLLATIPGGEIIPGHTYGLRLQVNPWSSVNHPDDAMPTDELPEEQELVTYPDGSTNAPLGNNTDYFRVFWPDGKLRRQPRVNIDPNDGSIVELDPVGFNDIIKSSGDEFPINFTAGKPFPQVIAAKGVTGTAITYETEHNPGIRVVERSRTVLTIDILGVTPSDGSGAGDYGYKVFGADNNPANWPSLGYGDFTVGDTAVVVPTLNAVDWGVNIFTNTIRGDRELGDRNYIVKRVDGDLVGTAAPDVIFCEFNGGGFFDYNTAFESMTNVKIRFSHATQGDLTRPLDIRVAGLDSGTAGVFNVIAIYTPVAEDWVVPLEPGAPGVLVQGETVDISLFDPESGSLETYPSQLTVINSNPNG